MAERAGRAVFGVNAAVSVALVVLVAAIALVVNPPSPPGIAAFAPQASKPITKAPQGQSATSGSGAGACASGQVCTRPSPTQRMSSTSSPAAVADTSPTPSPGADAHAGVPSALQCFAWPDGSITQTFDPQSPSCVASWPGAAPGNGGATSQGVSSTEIRVAFPRTSSGSSFTQLAPIVQFFNSHFELYGRKIVLVPYTSQQATGTDTNRFDASAQHADAVQVGSMKVFATTDFVDPHPYRGALPTFLDTLARAHVISVSGGSTPPLVTPAQLAHDDPYAWSYEPTSADLLAAVGHLTCAQLVGHLATHSSTYREKKRTFAVLLPTAGTQAGPIAGVSTLTAELAGCGLPNVEVVTYPGDGSSPNAALVKLKGQSITSVLYYPDTNSGPNSVQSSAGVLGYSPEWVTMGWEPLTLAQLLLGSAGETSSTFGVAEWNKLSAFETSPWAEAFVQAGGDTAQLAALRSGLPFYEEMLLLASGIQAAGPHLTPASFATALHALSFPNPGAAVAPSYQAAVGFGAGHTMVQDFAGFWLDRSGTTSVPGSVADEYQAFCYASLGRRYTSWPAVDRFFAPGCR